MHLSHVPFNSRSVFLFKTVLLEIIFFFLIMEFPYHGIKVLSFLYFAICYLFLLLFDVLNFLFVLLFEFVRNYIYFYFFMRVATFTIFFLSIEFCFWISIQALVKKLIGDNVIIYLSSWKDECPFFFKIFNRFVFLFVIYYIIIKHVFFLVRYVLVLTIYTWDWFIFVLMRFFSD